MSVATSIVNHLAYACERIGYLLALENTDSVALEAARLHDKVAAGLAFDELTDSELLTNNLTKLYNQIDLARLSEPFYLKQVHSALFAGSDIRGGSYRSTGMGFYRDNRLVHMTAPANQADKLTRQLLAELDNDELHPLLQAVNALYDFEFVQPFGKGNGCMAWLWLNGLLQRWKPCLRALPLEQRFKQVQQEYFSTLRQAVSDNDRALFIAFVLEQLQVCIEQLIEQAPNKAKGVSSENTSAQMSEPKLQKSSVNVETANSTGSTRDKLLLLLEQQPSWSAARAADVLGISSRAVEKHIARLKRDGLLAREGSARSGVWRVTRHTSRQLSLPEY